MFVRTDSWGGGVTTTIVIKATWKEESCLLIWTWLLSLAFNVLNSWPHGHKVVYKIAIDCIKERIRFINLYELILILYIVLWLHFQEYGKELWKPQCRSRVTFIKISRAGQGCCGNHCETDYYHNGWGTSKEVFCHSTIRCMPHAIRKVSKLYQCVPTNFSCLIICTECMFAFFWLLHLAVESMLEIIYSCDGRWAQYKNIKSDINGYT